MKRVQLIEIGILAVALIMGFKTIEVLLNTIIYILYSNDYPESSSRFLFWSYLIQFFIYLIGILLLFKNSKSVAKYINSLNKENETINLSIQKTELIYIIIVVLCIITFLMEISRVLVYTYDFFKKEVGGNNGDIRPANNSISLATFKIALVKIILVSVLLYFAKSVSKYFTKDNNTGNFVLNTMEENQS